MEALERTATPVPNWKGLVEYVYRLKTAIKIIGLPSGKDPDEVIREDPSGWRGLVQRAVPVEEFFLERVRLKHDLSTADGKAAAVEEAMAVIGEIPEPVQQAHYVQRLASMIGVEESILLQQTHRRRRRGGERAVASRREIAATARRQGDVQPGADLEGYCLAMILKSPELLEREPRLREEHFVDPTYREIFRRVAQQWEVRKGAVEPTELLERVRREAEGPLGERLEGLLAMESQHPFRFQDQMEEAYRSVAVGLVLSDLQLRKQQIEAAWAARDTEGNLEQIAALERAGYEIAVESHRLKLLGDTIPLRAIHKEVRHGG
jgi:DNA primase